MGYRHRAALTTVDPAVLAHPGNRRATGVYEPLRGSEERQRRGDEIA